MQLRRVAGASTVTPRGLLTSATLAAVIGALVALWSSPVSVDTV